MNWTIAKCAAAGVLTVMPIAAVRIAGRRGCESRRHAQCAPGAAAGGCPPTTHRHRPRSHGEYYNPNDYNDWWYYGGGGGGGGGRLSELELRRIE